jgi:hypothetical protein
MNMQFVNSRYNPRIQGLNPQTHIAMMPFARKNYYQRPVTQPQVIQQKEQTQVVPQNNPNKIKWGPPTWFLFHTLAHKIKDEYFSKIKTEFITNIVTICRNLPCPKCADHATEYMSKLNLAAIQTKDDLKNMLFKFHNDVNVRTGSPLFDYNDLNDKYNAAITINIIQNFFVFFKDKSFNVTAIANSMHRERITSALMVWFKNNIQCFDT